MEFRLNQMRFMISVMKLGKLIKIRRREKLQLLVYILLFLFLFFIQKEDETPRKKVETTQSLEDLCIDVGWANNKGEIISIIDQKPSQASSEKRNNNNNNQPPSYQPFNYSSDVANQIGARNPNIQAPNPYVRGRGRGKPNRSRGRGRGGGIEKSYAFSKKQNEYHYCVNNCYCFWVVIR